jgi:hypothetical protein
VFSTRTTIVDTVKGEVLGDLEEFKISRDGKPFASVDFNFLVSPSRATATGSSRRFGRRARALDRGRR